MNTPQDDLPSGATVSAEEFEHLQGVLAKPTGPSLLILKGARWIEEARRWREGWDYKPVGNGRVLAHAVGPQYVCSGVPLDKDFNQILQPDRATMQKVFADARKIAAVPALIDNLTVCVMQLCKVCEERDLMSDSDAAVIKSAHDLLDSLSSEKGPKP